ncbi:hexosaminidase D [Pelobates cultripes]|uniref:Hexosaminidase D n=1 Tax=Pelobates cultripes TaxID=61616 RepID=A0AAD1S6E6_PELCU|nr:hexosaminidase D [Pelobates cultripes]
MDGKHGADKGQLTKGTKVNFELILVHLDLKGAPPKVSYLAKILPLFSSLGANGLLIEYEDTFPYFGELLPLRAAHAYSPEEICEILRLAKLHNLEVIPLIQTFGHMEFVLKHKEFSHLREIPTYPNSLNPHRAESHQLIQAMLQQVMDLHPDIQWLHIGSDEVYYLGEGEESKLLRTERSLTVVKIFLSHLRAVATHVVSRFPGVKPIAWDDMLREASACTLTESGVPSLVQPMIWDYTANLDVENRITLVEKYQQCGFQKIWLASAFKGATGTNQQLTHIAHHLENHRHWLQVAEAVPQSILQGMALTGWQRYDHFSVLCELLPVAIPSLAVCLQFLKHGSCSEQVIGSVKSILGMPHLEIENFVSEPTGTFPGSDLLTLITQIICFLKTSMKDFLEGNRFVTGWFSPYHRKRKIVHPIMVQQIQPEAISLLSRWTPVMEAVQAALLSIYPMSTAEEWMEEYALPCFLEIQELVNDLNTALGNVE